MVESLWEKQSLYINTKDVVESRIVSNRDFPLGIFLTIEEHFAAAAQT